MNRMSSLPISEFCGGYSRVANHSGRAAIMSTAFHAKCAGEKDAAAKWARLTAEEQEQVSEWKKPADVVSPYNLTGWVAYGDMQKEFEVGLTANGRFCAANSPDCISVGHLDMAFLDGGIAHIGDIKKSEWTSEVGSLQLAAYGFAYADYIGAHSMRLGIWAATEGEWTWGPVIPLDSEEAAILWGRVLYAIQNTGEFATGSHCQKCYGRKRCPAYLLPPDVGETMLAPLVNQETITADKAAELLFAAQRVNDTAEMAINQLKDLARQGLRIRDGKGKVFLPVVTKGRKTLDTEALAKVVNLEDYQKRGADYDTFRWVKEK